MAELNSLKDILKEIAQAKTETAGMKKTAGRIGDLQKQVKKAAEQIKKSGKEFADAEE